MATRFNSIQSQPGNSAELHFASAGDEDLERVIGRIRRELLVLRQEQATISKRIAVIKRAITGLAEIFGSEVIDAELQTLLSQPSHRAFPPTHPGLTDLCRKSLRESHHPLTLPEIIEQIRKRHSVLLANHKNPRTSVSVVLRRLVDYSEAEAVLSPEGRCAWKSTAPHRLEATNQNGSPSQ